MNKKTGCLLLLVFINTFIFGQNQASNLFLPQKFLSFQTLIPVNEKDNTGFVKQIGAKHITDIVFNQVLTNKVKAYQLNYFSNSFPYDFTITDTLTTDEVNQNLVWHQPDFKADMAQIKYFNFVEEWIFDADAFVFEKKILAYQPVREYQADRDADEPDTRRSIIFSILNPENVQNASMIPCMKVKYEFLLDFPDKALQNKNIVRDLNLLYENNLIPESKLTPYWNSLVRNKIINSAFNKILSNSIPVFDINSGNYIPFAEVKKKSGISFDTIRMETNDGGMEEIIVQREFDARQIKSMYFVEDWFINTNNLNFSKNVIGLIPVYYHLNYVEDTLYTKTPLGMMYFNNENKERIELIYNQLTNENDFLNCLDGIHLFANLYNQSNNQFFKALCKEKKLLLTDFLNKQWRTTEQRLALYLLSQKINQPFDFNIFLNTDADTLGYYAAYFSSFADTTRNSKNKTLYLQNAKACLEKLNNKKIDCYNLTRLEDINAKLNSPTDMNKILASNDKMYLNCFADFYYTKFRNETGDKREFYKEKSKKIYAKLKEIDHSATTYLRCLDFNLLTRNQIIQKTDTTLTNDFIENKYSFRFQSDSIKTEFDHILYAGCQKYLTFRYIPEIVKIIYDLSLSLGLKFDDKLMLKSDNKDVLFDYYIHAGSANGQFLPNVQSLFSKYIENAGKDELWSMLYYQLVYYRWYDSHENIRVLTLDNVQTCLNKLTKISFDPIYKIIQFEMDAMKNVNHDPISYFDTKNNKELQAYAEYFTYGYSEYFYLPSRADNENIFVLKNKETGLKLFEKLISSNSADSIKRKASNVCFDLEFEYIQNNFFSKALNIAPKIQKLDASNERAISGLILAYLYNNQFAKAEQLTLQYKNQISLQFGTYASMIETDVKNINRFQSNADCEKILTLVKNQK